MSPALDSVLPPVDSAATPAPLLQVPWWRAPLAQIALPLGATVLLVAVVLAGAAWSLRVRTLQTAQQQIQALARVAAGFTARTLQNLDHVLAARPGAQALAAPAPYVQDWWMVDTLGRVRAGAAGTGSARAALDPVQWQALQRQPGSTLLQAWPATAGATPLVLAARAVRAPDQGFDGAILAVLSASHLGALWQQAQLGPLGTLALYSPQGELLVHSGTGAYTQRAPEAVMRRVAQSDTGAFTDGASPALLYGYQSLDAPAAAVVVVAQPLDQVLAPWRQWVGISATLWVVLALGAIATGWQLHRHAHQRQQSMALAQRQALRLRELSRRILDAQEAERSRVARELHDELGQSLTAIKINLQAQAQFKDANPAQWQADNLSMVEDALQQVRRLSLGLRPSILDTLGLTPALQWMGRELSQRSRFAFALEQDPHWPALDDDTQTCLFRIAQEALTNIARHARAQQVRVSLRAGNEHLVMEIHDDGAGFDPGARRHTHLSMGLSSMAERAALVGGRLGLASAPGQGCTITVSLPTPETKA